MSWNLFIDDEREVGQVFDDPTFWNFTVARSVPEAQALVLEHGCPQYISFDHDLGLDADGNVAQTGRDFSGWLIDQILDGVIGMPINFRFNVHSANPCGAAAIQGLMECFMQSYLSLCAHMFPEGSKACLRCRNYEEFPWDND